MNHSCHHFSRCQVARMLLLLSIFSFSSTESESEPFFFPKKPRVYSTNNFYSYGYAGPYSAMANGPSRPHMPNYYNEYYGRGYYDPYYMRRYYGDRYQRRNDDFGYHGNHGNYGQPNYCCYYY